MRAANPMLLFIVGWATLSRLPRQEPRVRRLLFAVAAVNLPLVLFFSWHDELRNLSLLFPVLFVLALDGVPAAWTRESYGPTPQ